MSGRSLLVVMNDVTCPIAGFGAPITDQGVRVEVRRPYAGDELPEAGTHDGLMVLGGEMGATDDDAHGWLKPTRELIAETVRLGQPTLGICLGHQLAAVALGGSIAKNPRGITVGLEPVGLAAEGREDPLLGGLDGQRVVHWNHDIVTDLPVGAVPLAYAPDGTVQAARFAPRAWGVQFHPEARADEVRRWGRHCDEGSAPTREAADAVLGEVEDSYVQLNVAWADLACRFASVVATQGDLVA